MSSFHLALLLNLAFLCTLSLHTQADWLVSESDYLVFHSCTSGSSFTPNGNYHKSLIVLLDSLYSDSLHNPAGFHTNSATSGDMSFETAYGLYMCRGDDSPRMCAACVRSAAKVLLSNSSVCVFKKEALIWFDQCLVRYSNRNFFSTMDEMPRNSSWKRDEYWGDENNFDSTRRSMVDDLIIQVANAAVGSKRFAVKEVEIPGDVGNVMYGLAQCIPYLSTVHCRECLENASKEFDECCHGKVGARVVYASCYIRYELNVFYQTASPPSPPSLQPAGSSKKIRPKLLALIVLIPIATLAMLLGLGFYHHKRKVKTIHKAILKENFGDDCASLESLQFDLATIEAATNKFSNENRVGKGGFGEVYKGILLDGQEIAVKKLSRSSTQGAIEFKNEILLIAKLQHKNLVALRGFCLEGQEKILIYEYLHNKSLDYFLFGPQRRRVLSWKDRFKIIKGIVEAILYLHEYSRLKVIHRDLKPSNILLDDNMNPKVSDFGMARMVAVDQNKGSTMRIVGTYGYMSPEYAMFGKFSEKSDVYSFGVMILEIVSGKRNSSSYESDQVSGLLNYAWRQWKNETPLVILDPNLKESCYEAEINRCIQIGLLCIQENLDDRLTIVMVHSYLNNFSVELPFPREPAFYMQGRLEPNMVTVDLGKSTDNAIFSINEMPTSILFPR